MCSTTGCLFFKEFILQKEIFRKLELRLKLMELEGDSHSNKSRSDSENISIFGKEESLRTEMTSL